MALVGATRILGYDAIAAIGAERIVEHLNLARDVDHRISTRLRVDADRVHSQAGDVESAGPAGVYVEVPDGPGVDSYPGRRDLAVVLDDHIADAVGFDADAEGGDETAGPHARGHGADTDVDNAYPERRYERTTADIDAGLSAGGRSDADAARGDECATGHVDVGGSAGSRNDPGAARANECAATHAHNGRADGGRFYADQSGGDLAVRPDRYARGSTSIGENAAQARIDDYAVANDQRGIEARRGRGADDRRGKDNHAVVDLER